MIPAYCENEPGLLGTGLALLAAGDLSIGSSTAGKAGPSYPELPAPCLWQLFLQVAF
jgi:hypothetical protein